MNMTPAELEGLQRINTVLASSPAWAAALTIFWVGMALMALQIHRKNGFGVRDTALSLVGLKRFERTVAINVTQLIAILVPLCLMTWAVTGGG
jgi:hypothetical protein